MIELFNAPGFTSQKQALEVLAEKIEMYYQRRIDDTYQEVQSRYNNNATALEWAEGEKESFEADKMHDLEQIGNALQCMKDKMTNVYTGSFSFRSIYRLQWDGINLLWRVV